LNTLRQITASVASDSSQVDSAADGITQDAARGLTDSLLQQVSTLRQLRSLHDVPVDVASRAMIRERLEEITLEDGIAETVDAEQRIFRHLGLVAPDADLMQIYKDVLEEQLAGFYDIDRRELVLADWLPASMQQMVAAHELTHALQDQHFSLRVRKKLRFDNRDAEAAWQALQEGDANAVMVELLGGPDGGIAAFRDSATVEDLLLEADATVRSQLFLGAPSALQDFMSFPYLQGLRFVAALHEHGGWQRVDDAFVHPPVSTEQILHPERYLDSFDGPVRIEQPSIHGILSNGYLRAAEMRLGEEDLRVYLKTWLDASMAAVASEGWGGCKVSLYSSSEAEQPDVFVMTSIWDSEDDALEMFGALIGVLEQRYPEQSGWSEMTNENQIVWAVDEDRQWVNVLRLEERQVTVLERVPTRHFYRVLMKLNRNTRYLDPTPDLRSAHKSDLVWNQSSRSDIDSALTLRVALPESWTPRLEADSDSMDTREVLVASRPNASLRVLVDRDAIDPLGAGGFAHSLAAPLQARGHDVYIRSDVPVSRDGVDFYELVFEQEEAGARVVYYVAVTDLRRGYGSVIIRETLQGDTPQLRQAFESILQSAALVPMEDAAPEELPPVLHNVGGQ
jgi:hypothetical protein